MILLYRAGHLKLHRWLKHQWINVQINEWIRVKIIDINLNIAKEPTYFLLKRIYAIETEKNLIKNSEMKYRTRVIMLA